MLADFAYLRCLSFDGGVYSCAKRVEIVKQWLYNLYRHCGLDRFEIKEMVIVHN